MSHDPSPPPEIVDALQKLGEIFNSAVENKNYGFTLFLFDLENSGVTYLVTNINRRSVIMALTELIEKMSQEEDEIRSAEAASLRTIDEGPSSQGYS